MFNMLEKVSDHMTNLVVIGNFIEKICKRLFLKDLIKMMILKEE